jgi:hypothetical protein
MSEPEGRLPALVVLRDDLVARMAVCQSDQNFAVMGRLLTDVLAQIDGLEAKPETDRTALDELKARRKTAGRPDSSRRTKTSG